FGIPIMSSTSKVDFDFLLNVKNEFSTHTMLLVGCVDNNDARRSFSNFIDHVKNTHSAETYWIDSGNERLSGQVILGGEAMPSASDLFPEILESSKDVISEISCAERLMQDEQNIFVNTSAA